MMNCINYIISQIDILLSLFPYAYAEYGYDEMAHVHTISVLPSHICEDEIFRRWQSAAISGFIDICPGENLCITQEDDIIGVGDLLYKKEGFGYSSACPTLFHLSTYIFDRISFGPSNKDSIPATYKENIISVTFDGMNEKGIFENSYKSSIAA